ncbi:MAG: hypothetical protein FJ253_06625 [Phycisphaerae bacterium]|nr:hypothetical protein [Phycisphaerae bacterium]
MEALITGWNLLLIIAGFCLLIALHELGHFLAARWAGIRVHIFALGMGPVVLSWRRGVGLRFRSTEREVFARHGTPASRMSDAELARHGLGETEYSLRLLPIGGFVGMLGQDDLDPSARSDDPRSYQRASIGKRMVVVSAGVLANLVLAVVLFVIAFMVGVRFEAPVIGSVSPDGPAAGVLQPGDRVKSIDGDEALTFADIRIAAAMSRPGAPTTMEIQRVGREAPIEVTIDAMPDPAGGIRSLLVDPGLGVEITRDPRAADDVKKAIDRAGLGSSPLGPGSTLLTIDGRQVSSADELALAAARSRGEPLRTTWRIHGADAEGGAGGSEVAATMVAPTVEIGVVPLLDRYRIGTTTDGAPIVERGFLGLLPLAKIGLVEPDSPNLGIIESGDVILRAGDTPGPSVAGLSRVVRAHGPGTIELSVLRDGAERTIVATIESPSPLSGGFPRLGVHLQDALDVPITAAPVERIVDSGSAARTEVPTPVSGLGILPLSRLVSLDGAPIDDWDSLRPISVRALGDAPADSPSTLELVVESPTPGRERRTLALPISPAERAELLDSGWAPALTTALFDPLQTTLTANGNPFRAIAMGFRQTQRMVLLTYLTLDRLFRGTVAVKELHGPVGIVHVGTRVADRGFMYLLFFLAMISVNLAVLNFLPLPIVDGGLFLFLIYEKIRGRPPSVAFQNAATVVGLFLIAGVFLLASYNDVMRLIGRS